MRLGSSFLSDKKGISIFQNHQYSVENLSLDNVDIAKPASIQVTSKFKVIPTTDCHLSA